jgi:hypothetical protein
VNPGLLWAHNDSGDGARFFGVGTDGRALGRVALTGAAATDIEDVAVALCPDEPDVCVWLADTGDNTRTRPLVELVIVPEPLADDAGLVGGAVAARIIPFSYEGGPVDVEALAVAADGTRAFLLEKVDAARARVFALDAPFVDDGSMVARVVATLASPGLAVVRLGRAITAADLHPGGTRLLVRVYTGLFEYRFGAGQSVDDVGSLSAATLVFGPLSEPQGEAVAYDAAGTGVFSVSEDPDGLPGRVLHRYRCR